MARENESFCYQIIPTDLGEAGIVRQQGSDPSLICMILLPDPHHRAAQVIGKEFPNAVKVAGDKSGIAGRLSALLSGRETFFDFAELDFERVKGFAEKVLKATFAIPRGYTMTYGGLAAAVGAPRAARAVGNAVAGNPFPLVIPCHRVVRSDGSPGKFGGGTELKKALLAREGVAFDSNDRVLRKHILEQIPVVEN